MSETVLVAFFSAAIALLVAIIGAWANLASTGRKLPWPLQLAGLFSVICVIVLGLQLFPRPSSSQNSTTIEPTQDNRANISSPEIVPSIQPSHPPAEQSVRNYFGLLNQGHDDEGQYQIAWKMLSERFITSQARKGGYSGYVGFWKDIGTPFQIDSVEILEQNNKATGFIKLIHLSYPANDQAHDYYVEFIWDDKSSQWLLDFSCESPYEEGCPQK